MAYLLVENISKSFNERVLFENISFVINKHEKTALIAKNGAGKTTILNIISKLESADTGRIIFEKGITVGYLKQEPDFDNNKTVMEQVFSSSDKIINAVRKYEDAMNSGKQKLIQESIEEMDILNAWDYESKIKKILHKLKIFNLNQLVSELSGGQKKRLALANALINKPDFLILDEPSNHLDFEMIEWLEGYLTKVEITILVVTHDRYFLDSVCSNIIELDDKKMFVYKGNYTYFLKKKAERTEKNYMDIEKAKNILKKESEWMSRQPKARGTKAKYRVENFYKIKDKADRKINNDKVGINIKSKRLGKKIIDIYGIGKKYDNKVLISDFSYKFTRLEKIGIVGNNGVGKSTFLNILANELQSDTGYLEYGETVVLAYYKQSGQEIENNMRVIDVIKDVADVISLGEGRTLSAARYLEHFLFPRDMHYSTVAKLSGGEKRRLYLMTVLMKNPNFLILDEPTNDLDIMTLNVIEEYLQNFNGNLLIVSHDRYFTDNVVDTLFIFEGNGKIRHFPGNYSVYNAAEKEKKLNKEIENSKKNVKNKKKIKVNIKKSNKLTYKERLELKSIEKELEELNIEKTVIEEILNSSNIESKKFAKKSKRYIELTEIIDEKEYRWLELDEKEN